MKATMANRLDSTPRLEDNEDHGSAMVSLSLSLRISPLIGEGGSGGVPAWRRGKVEWLGSVGLA